MTPVLDPFMAGVKPQGLQKGRGGFLRSADDAPWVTDPSGRLCISGARKGEVYRLKYGSPSNRGREIENDAALVKYRQRLSFLGVGMDTALAEQCRDLVLLDADSDEFKAAADKIAVEADKLTRSWLAADRGTHVHLLCERSDTTRVWADIIPVGQAVGIDTLTQDAVVAAWLQMLDDNGLKVLAIEASCVDDRWRLAGTLDRIVRTTKPLTFVKPGGELVTIPANTILVLDIKFGVCRKAHPIQIASYAQSVPYDTETEQRGVWPWPIDQTHALIAHGDFGDEFRPPSIELVWVDLVAGREHGGQCVVDAKAWAARDDVFSVCQLDDARTDKVAEAFDAQIVEGEGSAPAKSAQPSSSSTLSPVPPVPAAGEVEASPAFDAPPSPALSGDVFTPEQPMATTATWPLADPARLALVDARAALCPNPDEGADWSSDEFAPLWDELRGLFDDLDVAARAWRSELAGQAKRRHVDFLAQGGKTERRYWINKAVICLLLAKEGEDILRELLAHLVGDVALFPAIEPGHVLGSLNAVEAWHFANHVDDYLSVPDGAA